MLIVHCLMFKNNLLNFTKILNAYMVNIISYDFETCEQTASSFFQNFDHKIYRNT